MASGTLIIAALAGFVSAIVFSVVAWKLQHRIAGSPDSRRALAFFALWWYATAGNIAVTSTLYLAAALGAHSLEVMVVNAQVQRILLVGSLFGLLVYLGYLVTGRFFVRTFAILQSAHGAVLLYAIFARRPVGVRVGDWRTDLIYELEGPAWWGLVSFVLILIPAVGLSAAYFVIAVKRQSQPGGRYRATLVASAIVAWWVVAVFAGRAELQDVAWLQMLNRAVGLVAALAILAAYFPPRIVRGRLGLEAPRAHS